MPKSQKLEERSIKYLLQDKTKTKWVIQSVYRKTLLLNKNDTRKDRFWIDSGTLHRVLLKEGQN